MKLAQVIKNVIPINPIESWMYELEIDGITNNSQDVKENFLFVAIKGFQSDGHDFIEQAIFNGAKAIIGENPAPPLPVPYIQVKNSRKTLGLISKNFYQNPTKNKKMIGITGTNGKTTISYLVRHLLQHSGISCGLIGTIEIISNGCSFPSLNTTPDSLSLHKIFSKNQDQAMVMEVSSHGMTQYRVEGVQFDFGLFTNLDHEHLDYHDTMEDYFNEKKRLFHYLRPQGVALINTDDYWGKNLANELRNSGKTVLTIGHEKNNHFQIKYFDEELSFISFIENRKLRKIPSPLPGVHNMYNTIMAYALARQFGLTENEILTGLHSFQGVPGRFETIQLTNGAKVTIDYAHTKDAFHYSLKTIKKNARRIIHIFGFRGNRDVSKRKGMLETSAYLSDKYILTFDDLNGVPKEKMLQTLQSLNEKYGNSKGIIIPDRTLAIRYAIKQSMAGDWIIITGKGHERYKENFYMQTTSDKETVHHIIEALQKDKNFDIVTRLADENIF